MVCSKLRRFVAFLCELVGSHADPLSASRGLMRTAALVASRNCTCRSPSTCLPSPSMTLPVRTPRHAKSLILGLRGRAVIKKEETEPFCAVDYSYAQLSVTHTSFSAQVSHNQKCDLRPYAPAPHVASRVWTPNGGVL